MKALKGIAIVGMLLAAFLLMQDTAVAQREAEGCCMTGGGKLFGKFRVGPNLTPKTLMVDYGLLLCCPEYEESAQPTGPAFVTVKWSGGSFIMKRPIYNNCYSGDGWFCVNLLGEGLYNWMPGYRITAEFCDGIFPGGRNDDVLISIYNASSQNVFYGYGNPVVAGQGLHCPIPD